MWKFWLSVALLYCFANAVSSNNGPVLVPMVYNFLKEQRTPKITLPPLDDVKKKDTGAALTALDSWKGEKLDNEDPPGQIIVYLKQKVDTKPPDAIKAFKSLLLPNKKALEGIPEKLKKQNVVGVVGIEVADKIYFIPKKGIFGGAYGDHHLYVVAIILEIADNPNANGVKEHTGFFGGLYDRFRPHTKKSQNGNGKTNSKQTTAIASESKLSFISTANRNPNTTYVPPSSQPVTANVDSKANQIVSHTSNEQKFKENRRQDIKPAPPTTDSTDIAKPSSIVTVLKPESAAVQSTNLQTNTSELKWTPAKPSSSTTTPSTPTSPPLNRSTPTPTTPNDTGPIEEAGEIAHDTLKNSSGHISLRNSVLPPRSPTGPLPPPPSPSNGPTGTAKLKESIEEKREIAHDELKDSNRMPTPSTNSDLSPRSPATPLTPPSPPSNSPTATPKTNGTIEKKGQTAHNNRKDSNGKTTMESNLPSKSPTAPLRPPTPPQQNASVTSNSTAIEENGAQKQNYSGTPTTPANLSLPSSHKAVPLALLTPPSNRSTVTSITTEPPKKKAPKRENNQNGTTTPPEKLDNTFSSTEVLPTTPLPGSNGATATENHTELTQQKITTSKVKRKDLDGPSNTSTKSSLPSSSSTYPPMPPTPLPSGTANSTLTGPATENSAKEHKDRNVRTTKAANLNVPSTATAPRPQPATPTASVADDSNFPESTKYPKNQQSSYTSSKNTVSSSTPGLTRPENSPTEDNIYKEFKFVPPQDSLVSFTLEKSDSQVVKTVYNGIRGIIKPLESQPSENPPLLTNKAQTNSEELLSSWKDGDGVPVERVGMTFLFDKILLPEGSGAELKEKKQEIKLHHFETFIKTRADLGSMELRDGREVTGMGISYKIMAEKIIQKKYCSEGSYTYLKNDKGELLRWGCTLRDVTTGMKYYLCLVVVILTELKKGEADLKVTSIKETPMNAQDDSTLSSKDSTTSNDDSTDTNGKPNNNNRKLKNNVADFTVVKREQ